MLPISIRRVVEQTEAEDLYLVLRRILIAENQVGIEISRMKRDKLACPVRQDKHGTGGLVMMMPGQFLGLLPQGHLYGIPSG